MGLVGKKFVDVENPNILVDVHNHKQTIYLVFLKSMDVDIFQCFKSKAKFAQEIFNSKYITYILEF
jgi:hypothetical protein